MRVSQEEKERSRERIVASASRMFRERGLDGASVADVMKEAGLTHGGFYKHFDSKAGLVEAALEEAFAEFATMLEAGEAAEAMTAYRSLYLSQGHRDQPGRGCPIAALGTEMARSSSSLKAAFGRGVRRMVDAIAATRKGSAASRREAALRDFSMLVGAMIIARSTDPELSEEVLAACGRDTANVR